MKDLSPTVSQDQQIEDALQKHLSECQSALFEMLAALILFVTAFFSIAHAIVRVLVAGLGLLLWALALLVVLLYWLRAWAVSRSANALHHDGIGRD